jgi:hypothetical protein
MLVGYKLVVSTICKLAMSTICKFTICLINSYRLLDKYLQIIRGKVSLTLLSNCFKIYI